MTIREKYSKEIEVINNLNKYQAYTIEETTLTEYAIRTIYANNFVPSLCIEQIGGTIFSLYLAD